MNARRWVLVVVIVFIAALVGVVALFAGGLRAWAFSQTGEEALFGQVRGVGELVLNLAQPRRQLALDAQIAHTGVNPFGINTFLHHEVEPEKREQQLALISAAGFRWIRQEFPWEDIEIHERGDFTDRRNDPAGIDAWLKYDQIVALADEYGVEIIARLSNPPSWSRAAGDEMGTHAPPDDYDDYARFAATVAERYRGQIRYYQVWNEPNIYPEWGELPIDPEGYTDLLCRAYRAIKAADPDAVVLSAPLAPTLELDERNLNDLIFLQRMYDAGAAGCFDILSTQGYMLWSGPTDRRMQPVSLNYAHVEYVRDVMVRNGDAEKPIWISETNSNASPEDVEPRYGRVTLQQQARYAPLAYQRAQEDWPFVGVIAFWYFKRAEWTWLEERRPEAYFQMADPDFNLMPVYDSMKEYANQPPVMYRGRHAAGHWAVQPGEGWSEDDNGLRAASGAEPLSLTFDGAALGVELASGGITYRVDGGPAQNFTSAGGMETIWRGRGGEHTILIEPAGEAVIAAFRVADAPRPGIAGIVAALVILSGILYAFWRARRVSEAGSG